MLVNYILEIEDYDDNNFQQFDMNNDGTLNVLDIILIIELITF